MRDVPQSVRYMVLFARNPTTIIRNEIVSLGRNFRFPAVPGRYAVFRTRNHSSRFVENGPKNRPYILVLRFTRFYKTPLAGKQQRAMSGNTWAFIFRNCGFLVSAYRYKANTVYGTINRGNHPIPSSNLVLPYYPVYYDTPALGLR